MANILDYDIIKSGQTYMYSSQPVLYPFGYGLSYSTFRYGNMHLSTPSMGADGSVTASVDVTNTGSRAGGMSCNCMSTRRNPGCRSR